MDRKPTKQAFLALLRHIETQAHRQVATALQPQKRYNRVRQTRQMKRTEDPATVKKGTPERRHSGAVPILKDDVHQQTTRLASLGRNTVPRETFATGPIYHMTKCAECVDIVGTAARVPTR
ncbi:hypothetical protein [Brevibacterium permense]|uniref:hypothetical protein n=1 Tax=Brevibacterium permense TaxID=234834 RepID=UPI001566CB3C|nr:hypothetical protein [Brevibacterium permense]